MDSWLTSNEAALNYARFRPTYTDKLVEDAIRSQAFVEIKRCWK